VRRFKTKEDGCEAILIAGDKPTIDRIWQQTTRTADDMYNADGGRKRTVDEHERTHDQRMFDALTGSITNPNAATASNETAKAPAAPEGPRRIRVQYRRASRSNRSATPRRRPRFGPRS